MSYLFADCDRCMTRGSYATDLSNLKEGFSFPDNETLGRNKVYRFNMKLYTGEYASNKNLVAIINDIYTPINYKVIPLNYFKLIVNKLDSLLFGNEITIQSGDIERDKQINKLVERTSWLKSIREAVKLCEIYGDSCIKTYRNGASAFAPLYAYKVVDSRDKKQVKAYVLHELLYNKEDIQGNFSYKPEYIRILISCKGFEYERVYEYEGNNISGKLGRPLRYKYNNRWIPRKGRYYWTGIDDCETVQWLSVNIEDDGVYGTSSFRQIQDIVFAIENRLSTENWVIDAHGKPLLIAGMSAFKTDELTGDYYLSVINGKYLVDKGGADTKPEYLTWDGKLDASKQVRDDLMSAFYELTEMGKTFLSGEYTGNVSEESLNNIIKSAIDRGNREINDLWYDIRKSLYVLCRLNSIDVTLEELNITFNIGRVDDTKVIADTCSVLTSMGLFSKHTLLTKFWGYNSDDADEELNKIKQESKAGENNDSSGDVETVVRV